MSRIMFRQKTPEEIEADAVAKKTREAGTTEIERQPSAAAPPASEPLPLAAEVDDDGFALEPDTGAPKPKKGRKR